MLIRNMLRRSALMWGCLGLGCVPAAVQAQQALSEQDFFAQLPVVLTVSRLAQPLNEVPGAVTVLDRDTIRRSGARDVADLLRLVPGYMVGGRNGASPTAAYHAPVDDYGVRNLVMIDGRSVHSPYYLGGTHVGMMGVLLEDIERIEVLRGANSAAHGANALLGVINIITRHAADTLGAEVGLTVGGAHARDQYARIGWGDGEKGFRLSAGERRDTGYAHAFDDLRLRQVHFRSDWRPAQDDDVLLEGGLVEREAGAGLAGFVGDPETTTHTSTRYLLGQWLRQLSEAEQIKLLAYYTEEVLQDQAPYIKKGVPPGILLDYSGTGRRLNVELQHQRNLADHLRAVWGLGAKRDEVRSRPLYSRDDALSIHEERLFGNLEWRWSSMGLLNAGLFVGNHSRTGHYVAPRLMANWQLAPDHTLRAGVTRGVRPPGQFELDGDVRYTLNGQWVGRTFASRGRLDAEVLDSQEIGYFGQFRDWRMTLDVRVYRERLTGLIATEEYLGASALPLTGVKLRDFINKNDFETTGIEYQWRWQPMGDTEIWFNQSLSRLAWNDPALNQHQPPRLASSVAWFQRLPGQANLTVLWHVSSRMTWYKMQEELPPSRRVDVRLAYPFRWGATRAEAALTVQALNGDQSVQRPSENFRFERRALATLRLAF